MPKVAITGATGHSGRYLMQELANSPLPDPIVCLVRPSSDTSTLDICGLAVQKMVGDLTDQTFVHHALVGVDTVLNIAGIFHSVTVVKAAIRSGVSRVILVHTTGIFSQFKSASAEYQRIEHEVSQLIAHAGYQVNLTILRPTMIFGYLGDSNMAVFIKLIDTLPLLPVIDGGQALLQPVHGADLGRAYYTILSQDLILSGDYVLSGERPVTMLEMFLLIRESLQTHTFFPRVPLSFGAFAARVTKILTLGRVDFVERVLRMAENRSFPHDAAYRDFGYSPQPFTDGVRAEVLEYRKARRR